MAEDPAIEQEGGSEQDQSNNTTLFPTLTRDDTQRSRELHIPEFGRVRRSATGPMSPSPLSPRARPEGSPAGSRNRGRTLGSRPRIDTNVGQARSPLPKSPLGRRDPREDSMEHMDDIIEEGGAKPRPSIQSDRDFTHSGVRQRTGTITGRQRRNTVRSMRPSIAISTARSIHSDAQSFSLAGPEPVVAQQANVPFVQPGYSDLNPAYKQQAQVGTARPVWGLAKPLPRVIRPGMVPTVEELRQSQAVPEKPQEGDIDLEKGRQDKLPKLNKIDSQVVNARERRENRLLSRLGSIVQDIRPSMSHDGHLTPPEEALEEPESEEVDLGLARPAEHQVASPSQVPYPSGTEPFVPYEDTASTIHEDFKDDPNWEDTDLLHVDPHDIVDEYHNNHTRWAVVRTYFREPFAELVAVVVQLTIGFCADLVVTTSSSASGNESTDDWAWGLATMLGIYIAGGISGAHLNPAISIMLYIYRGFPLRKVPSYIFAQLLGAFIAGLLSYGLYRQNIAHYGGSDLSTGGTMNDFITNLRFEYINAATGFFNEFVGTAFLAIAVLALGDDSNAPPGAGMNALIIGLVITVLSMAFGYNTGAAMNGTRDLGPRLALLCVGYGGELFRDPWWVYGPWVATIFGAIFGAGVYDVFIFVGGESPINYPKRRMKRAGHKWKKRMGQRFRKAKRKMKSEVEDDAHA